MIGDRSAFPPKRSEQVPNLAAKSTAELNSGTEPSLSTKHSRRAVRTPPRRLGPGLVGAQDLQVARARTDRTHTADALDLPRVSSSVSPRIASRRPRHSPRRPRHSPRRRRRQPRSPRRPRRSAPPRAAGPAAGPAVPAAGPARELTRGPAAVYCTGRWPGAGRRDRSGVAGRVRRAPTGPLPPCHRLGRGRRHPGPGHGRRPGGRRAVARRPRPVPTSP